MEDLKGTHSVNPFPLIRETWDRIGVEEMLRAVLPKFTQGRGPDNPLTEPAFIDAFNRWHMQTEGSTQGLLNLVCELRPLKDEQSPHENDQWDLLTNGLNAFDFRLQQFEALLHWARITWEYDPQIYAAIKSQEIDGEDRGPEQPDSEKVTPLHLSEPAENRSQKRESIMKNEDYSSGMVTEIYPGDDHPFPIPEKVMEHVHQLRSLLRPVGQMSRECSTFRGDFTYGPSFLSDWENSQANLKEICAAMHETCWQMNGNEGNVIRGLILGLEREVLRQDALWTWVRETLQYDPSIRAAVDLQPDPGSEESTASSEAPALQ